MRVHVLVCVCARACMCNTMDSFSLIIKSMASIYSHRVAQLLVRGFKNRLQKIGWRQQKGPGDLGLGFMVFALTPCRLQVILGSRIPQVL